jgi:hypothetical protein
MKRQLLISTAAVALSFAIAPAMAQTDQPSRHHDRIERQQSQRATGETSRHMRRSTTGQNTREENTNAPQKSASEPTSQAPSAEHNRSGKASQADKKAPSREQKAQQRSPEQTGAAQPRESSPNATQKNATNPDRNSNSARSDQSRPNSDQRNASRSGQARVSSSLDPQRKQRLHSAFARLDIRPLDRVDFSISVGTVVPTHVHLRPLPSTIVEIVPRYRGYDFIAVRDEIVIVEPRTHKVVDVIERGPSHARAESKEKVKLSSKQRDVIRKHVSHKRTVTTGSEPSQTVLEIGESVPESVQIESFPEEVYSVVPEVRSYRYIERGNDVYLVDPDSRRVIEEIR